MRVGYYVGGWAGIHIICDVVVIWSSWTCVFCMSLNETEIYNACASSHDAPDDDGDHDSTNENMTVGDACAHDEEETPSSSPNTSLP